MTNKFKVYAQTRATRQLAGDVAVSIRHGQREDYETWQEIERLLEEVERKLERIDLK